MIVVRAPSPHTEGSASGPYRTARTAGPTRTIRAREYAMADQPRWLHDEALFAAEAERGHGFAHLVARRLSNEGLPAVAAPLVIDRDRSHWADWAREDEDVIIERDGRRRCHVEVKSRRIRFTGPDDWPASHDPAMIDTVGGWHAKGREPVAVVLVSQYTRAMAVVPMSSRPFWRPIRAFDRRRQIPTVSYGCPAEYLRSFAQLVEHLR